MTISKGLDLQTIVDGKAHAVLLFDAEGRLRTANKAAQALFGADFKLLRSEGWAAAAALFNSRAERTIDQVQAEALATGRPVPFSIAYHGERLPCRASTLKDQFGEPFMLVTAEQPDWTPLKELLDRFLLESREAVISTQGHADLIRHSLEKAKPGESPEKLTKRIGGFVRLISNDMARSARLLDLMARLQAVRLGLLREQVAASRRKLDVRTFIEDLMEELDNGAFVDPDTEAHDFRARVTLDFSGKPAAAASPVLLAGVLRDVIRNAIMYSMRATPITIQAAADGDSVYIRVTDAGYGIRASETERVFAPFERARQPQVIGEFGYGLGLYLCKHEVEAMNGRLWFESEEGAGATFTIKLPAWDAAVLPASGSSSSAP